MSSPVESGRINEHHREELFVRLGPESGSLQDLQSLQRTAVPPDRCEGFIRDSRFGVLFLTTDLGRMWRAWASRMFGGSGNAGCRWIPGGRWLLLVGFGWYSAPWVGGVFGAWVAGVGLGVVWKLFGTRQGCRFSGRVRRALWAQPVRRTLRTLVGIGHGSLRAGGCDLICVA